MREEGEEEEDEEEEREVLSSLHLAPLEKLSSAGGGGKTGS